MVMVPNKHKADTAELANELRKRISGEVRFDDFSRVLYSTDASMYQMEPIGVVIPRDVEDVLAAVEVAKTNRLPLLPRGGGTSLAGQTVNHAIVLDFSKYMSQVVEVNPEEAWARVEPGVVLEQLNDHVAPHRFKFAPDPATSNRSCVGGAIGNNSCGSHSVIYGKAIDHVLELDVILSDGSQAHFGPQNSQQLNARLSQGSLESSIYQRIMQIGQDNREEILQRYPKIMRRVAGYNLDEFIGDNDSTDSTRSVNLASMVVGSEGTLCVVTEAKVNLVPTPAHKGLAVLHFEDMFRACDASWDILQHGPSAVELLGEMILEQCRNSLGFKRLMWFIEGTPKSLLIVEFYGESEAEVDSKLIVLERDMAKKGLGYACVKILDPVKQAEVWELRRAGLGLMLSVKGDSKPLPYVEDTAVDPQRLGEYIRRFDDIVRAHGTTAGYYGHASVGCVHVRPLVNLNSSGDLNKMVSITSDISDLVLEFGGSLSGEHGDGIVRGAWTQKMFGPKLYEAFLQVKQAFDPHRIMNPGKIVDSPPMTENLRIHPDYRAASLGTKLDFSEDFGYAGAVEMCNGMGACRKTTGTMCPSYMATKEEEHSTRGRANLLRAALSGALPPSTLTGHRLHEALDLCLECKGCKAECQTGVDMAKLKYEFLDRYNRKHGLSLRGRLFANISSLSRWGSRFAPVSNWLARTPPAKFVLHTLIGIHGSRPVPPFARPTFPNRFSQVRTLSNGHRGDVVLYNDSFMNYNYPQVGVAAVEILERAGYNVVLANAECCGRPMISKGLLDKSREHAQQNVDLLYPYAQQGIPIVGCEPSCLLTLRDEFVNLITDPRAKVVAEHSYLIDEFLDGLREKAQLDLEFTDLKKNVLFHGHCHQKALIGTQHSVATLRLPPGYNVEDVKSGCCGMAGSFGFEKEHYGISMAIGRMSLVPTIESKGDDWEIAVMGVSCRQQIEHATGRRARHLVEVLREALN